MIQPHVDSQKLLVLGSWSSEEFARESSLKCMSSPRATGVDVRKNFVCGKGEIGEIGSLFCGE